MASTIRTIDIPGQSTITVTGYDGPEGIAFLRVGASGSVDLDRSEIQQLISALLDVMATLPGGGVSSEQLADECWAVWRDFPAPHPTEQRRLVMAVKAYRYRADDAGLPSSLRECKEAIEAAQVRARKEVQS